MDWIVDIFTSNGMGMIGGLVGGVVTKITEYKAKKADNEFKLEMGRISLQETRLEQTHELAIADKEIQRAKVEGDIEVESKEVDAFTASQKNAHKVTGWLRAVRPAITGYVLIMCTVLFFAVWNTVGGLEAFDAVELKSLLDQMIEAALFLAITCVSWWFASRGGNLAK